MDHAERQLVVARVCSGSVRVDAGGRTYLVRRPGREHVYLASEVYRDVLRESDGLYADDELVEFLVSQGFWDEARGAALELLPRQIEESKVALYRAAFKANERKVIRRALAAARAEFARLSAERHAFDHLSRSGAAGIAQARYLVGVGLHTPDGRRVFGDDDFWESPSAVLDEVMAALAAARLGEAEFREVARSEPWRSVWNGGRVERSLFGTPPADWTDDQRSLVNWSLLYDSVYQHPECPADDVVADDDLLDGWLACQRRGRRSGGADDLVANEKVRGSQEVYLVADTAEDARKVVGLNDEFARATQRQRFAHLARKGEVSELDMPDTAVRLRTEVTQKLTRMVAGGK